MKNSLKEAIQKLTDDFIITHDIDKFDQALIDLFVSYGYELIGEDREVDMKYYEEYGWEEDGWLKDNLSNIGFNQRGASMREKLEGWVT